MILTTRFRLLMEKIGQSFLHHPFWSSILEKANWGHALIFFKLRQEKCGICWLCSCGWSFCNFRPTGGFTNFGLTVARSSSLFAASVAFVLLFFFFFFLKKDSAVILPNSLAFGMN